MPNPAIRFPRARLLSVIATIAVLVGASGCNEPTTATLPDNVEIKLMNPVAWPASNLVLVSSAFVPPSELPEVLLDGASVTVSRQNDSTVTAALPDSSGTFDITVHLRGGSRFGSVRTVGYVGLRPAVALAGWALPVTPGSPVVVAGGESTLVQMNLATGGAASVGAPFQNYCTRSAGPSFNGTVVAQGPDTGLFQCRRPYAYQLGGTPTVTDSGPNTGVANLWAQLNATVWFRAGTHWAYIYHAASTDTLQLEDTQQVVFSPDHSVAAIVGYGNVNGMPVLDAAAGSIKYRLADGVVDAAAFSNDGDTLFAVVGNAPTHLRAIATATGTVFATAADSLPPYTYAATLDPAAPWLYASDGNEVQVFDRHSLARLARLQFPVSIGGQITLSVDPVARRLYLLQVQNWLDPFYDTAWSMIAEVETLPVQQQPQTLAH